MCKRADFRRSSCAWRRVLGERYTRGHVIDFVRQLRRRPEELTVLGNGKQRKSYLHVTIASKQ